MKAVTYIEQPHINPALAGRIMRLAFVTLVMVMIAITSAAAHGSKTCHQHNAYTTHCH